MIKVVYNNAHCPFTISPKAFLWLRERGSGDLYDCCGNFLLKRHHPLLVKCVEILGDQANGWINCGQNRIVFCELEVAEIPGNYYYIENNGGRENVIGIRDMIRVER